MYDHRSFERNNNNNKEIGIKHGIQPPSPNCVQRTI